MSAFERTLKQHLVSYRLRYGLGLGQITKVRVSVRGWALGQGFRVRVIVTARVQG